MTETGTERTARYSDPSPSAVDGSDAGPYSTTHANHPVGHAANRAADVSLTLSAFTRRRRRERLYYKVADGTWTTEEWIHGDDLLALFEPAGWSVESTKPTYLLTRQHGVEDHHDLMTDGGRHVGQTNSGIFELEQKTGSNPNERPKSSVRTDGGSLVLEDWCDWCADEDAELTHKVWVNERDIYLRFCSRSCAMAVAGSNEQFHDIEKTEVET